jgi:HK97 family phage major capsid protein
LVDGAGKLIFNPQMISSFGQFNLFGYPIRFIDAMPPIASNARAYLFGNMEGYTIVDRMGIEMLVDPYTGYPNIRHNVMKRTGGHLTAGDRFKIGVCATL